MSEKDGGSAFPISDPVLQNGMSLRDYFAGQALTGILAAYTGQDTPLPTTKFAAITAFDFADAMLAERAK